MKMVKFMVYPNTDTAMYYTVLCYPILLGVHHKIKLLSCKTRAQTPLDPLL